MTAAADPDRRPGEGVAQASEGAIRESEASETSSRSRRQEPNRERMPASLLPRCIRAIIDQGRFKGLRTRVIECNEKDE